MTSRARRLLPGIVLVAAFAALLGLASPAAAASACARAVVDDWSDGRIDKQYPLHCYREAIELLPRDVRDYSSADEDMRRALQAARRGRPAPPNRDPAAPEQAAPEQPAPAEQPETPTPAPPTSTDVDEPAETNETAGAPPTDGDDGLLEAVPAAETENAASPPIPLLVLAGLALLLLAGGAAGYLIRRVQGRNATRTTP